LDTDDSVAEKVSEWKAKWEAWQKKYGTLSPNKQKTTGSYGTGETKSVPPINEDNLPQKIIISSSLSFSSTSISNSIGCTHLLHDIFMSYRWKTEESFADELYLQLSKSFLTNGTNPSIFLDVRCVRSTDNKEMAILFALDQVSIIVLLISEAGLEEIKSADKHRDRVLMEYEQTLIKYNHHSCNFNYLRLLIHAQQSRLCLER